MGLTHFSLSELAQKFIQEQLATGKYSSPDEVVSCALEEARLRQAKRELSALLQEGLDSGPPIQVTEEWRREQRAQYLAKLPTELKP